MPTSPGYFCASVVAVPEEDALATTMENAGSEALADPVLVEITTLEYVPTLAAVGVPESAPFAMLNDAQDGLLEIENVAVCPLGTVTVGLKEYAVPAVAVVGGVPLMASLVELPDVPDTVSV